MFISLAIKTILVKVNLKCLVTIMECVHDCLLFQHVKEPTRFRHGQNPSLIDLTFTNGEGMVDLPGLGISDHGCLRFIFQCDKQVRQEFMPTYNFFQISLCES